MEVLTQYSPTEFAAIGISLLLLGMNKGGFPVGSIAIPLLVLVWPSQSDAARGAVGFMLPMLCLMDIVAVTLYRKEIEWKKLLHILPGSLLGVAVASALFVSEHNALVAVSDKVLKIAIGLLGLIFVGYFAIRKWIFARLHHAQEPNWTAGTGYGIAAGVTSTLAHAAVPVMQMYLLPQHLPKLRFAATMAAYFFVLNLVKMVPFSLMGRIQADNLKLGLVMLPVLPLGVLLGHALVKITKQHHYIAFIYVVLFITSILLIVKAVT